MFSQTTVLNSSWSIRGTGACVTPIPVEPGQTLQADFGWLGAMKVRFV
jgi:2-keto-4-pentenoate hydratase